MNKFKHFRRLLKDNGVFINFKDLWSEIHIGKHQYFHETCRKVFSVYGKRIVNTPTGRDLLHLYNLTLRFNPEKQSVYFIPNEGKGFEVSFDYFDIGEHKLTFEYLKELLPLRELESHIESLEDWCDSYQYDLDNIFLNNKTNAPYHNTRHLFGVGYLCWASVMYKLNQYENLHYTGDDDYDPKRTKHIYDHSLDIAGLYHDYCYLRKENDALTIEETIRNLPTIVRDDINVYKLILLSEFPHKSLEDVPERLANTAVILREADMLYSTVFCTEEVIYGLWKEIWKDHSKQGYVDFIKRNIEFIKGLEFAHPVFQKLNRLTLPRAISIHQTLLTKLGIEDE